MRIHVEGNYYIAYDGRNHTLEEEGVFEKGKNVGVKTVTVLGYYPSIKSCAMELLKLEINESTAKELRELIVDVARIETKIDLVMEHVKFQVKKVEVAS